MTDVNGIAAVPVNVLLAGWSALDDISKAAIKLTGFENMRKVENYQLGESDLREISSLLEGVR